MEAQLGLAERLRVSVVFLKADADADVPTPELTSVIGWLYRMGASDEADWDSVVWTDDVLGRDARDWAKGHEKPVHLEQPDPGQGLTEANVAGIEVFIWPKSVVPSGT